MFLSHTFNIDSFNAYCSGLFLAVSAYHDQFSLFPLSTSYMRDINHEVLISVTNFWSIL